MGILNKIKKTIKDKIDEKNEERKIYNQAYRDERKTQLDIQARQTAIVQRKEAVRKAKQKAKNGTFSFFLGTNKPRTETVVRTKRPAPKKKFVVRDGIAYPLFKERKRKKKKRKKEKDILDFGGIL